jgi:long-subunit fatty acid transport protein
MRYSGFAKLSKQKAKPRKQTNKNKNKQNQTKTKKNKKTQKTKNIYVPTFYTKAKPEFTWGHIHQGIDTHYSGSWPMRLSWNPMDLDATLSA